MKAAEKTNSEQHQANLQHQQLNKELESQVTGSQLNAKILMDFGEPVNADDEEEFKSGEKLGLGLTDLAVRPNSATPVMNQQRGKLA
jgi:hypothetical protein